MKVMNTEEKKALVETMKAQHAQLALDLEELRVLATGEAPERAAIVAGLARFSAHLAEHLELEDGTFYPAYIAQKRQLGEDTERVTQYMKEMQVIAKAVSVFVASALPEGIETAEVVARFIPQLKRISQMLAVRIETEEEGPYEKFLAE